MFDRIRRALSLLLVTLWISGSSAAPVEVRPDAARDFTLSLNDRWSFKYLPALEPGADAAFSTTTFDASAWKTIEVPANWELAGFGPLGYDKDGLKDGLGLYRRTFRTPATWSGRRTFLRFDGVAYGFTVWVNGHEIGASNASAYDRHTFDITDALLPAPQADNLLAVQVTTKPFGWEFDVNDDWSLSGIYRDVTLFSVPATHVRDLTATTRVSPDGTTDLNISVTVSQPGATLRGKLLAPDGKTVRKFTLEATTPAAADTFAATVRVPDPQLWTAETPSLYRLQLALTSAGQPPQTVVETIGLREISIKDGVLLLNNRPFKLRGVNYHHLDPVHGRAVTEADLRRDLALMKKANINHIRTSHYPPTPRLLELCDELGFYVMDEAALGSRGYKLLQNPAYRDTILARTRAPILRDKNHASVIVWSIGNENPYEDIEVDAARAAKELDPTRPVCLPQTPSHFEQSWPQFPEIIDSYSPHYPTNAELLVHAKTLKRPTIYSEFAHSWGLAFDQLQDQWEIMQATPQLTGGAIWMFQDQGLLRTSSKPFDPKKIGAVWLDETRCYDTNDGAGADGIVYADRTPQSDYWQTRKVFSPVQISETSAAVKPGSQKITLTVENRHDFRALTGMKLAWSLRRNGAEQLRGSVPLQAKPHQPERVAIPVKIPADATSDVLALDVRCLDEAGLQLTERTVRLDLADADRRSWPGRLPAAEKPVVTDNGNQVKIAQRNWVLTVTRPSGELTIADRTGQVIVAGIHPHTGHAFTLTETRLVKKTNLWSEPVLTRLTDPSIQVTQADSKIRLSVRGTYPRTVDAAQSLVGGYEIEFTPAGALAVSYDYAPTNAKGAFTEAGLSVVLPAAFSEFRWIGQGIHAGYPGKDRLNEFGLFHLNRADLRFQGNRRATELALLTTPGGAGVALVPSVVGDVAVERDGAQTRLSHNAVVSSPGNKGWAAEHPVLVETTPHITGSFTLVPLTDTWPSVLTRWFGKPAAARDVFRPFFHSYDQ